MSEENTANVCGIFLLGDSANFRIFVSWKNAHTSGQWNIRLWTPPPFLSLFNKSGDRIILTREKIDLSLRATKSSDELSLTWLCFQQCPIISIAYLFQDNTNRTYVRNRNIFIKIHHFNLLFFFFNLFASDNERNYLDKDFSLSSGEAVYSKKPMHFVTYLSQVSNFVRDFSSFWNTRVPFSLSPTTHCQRENKVGAIGRVITIRHVISLRQQPMERVAPALFFH